MRRCGFYALLVLLGAAFLLLYSSTTSPLASNYYGQDSAFFQYVGSAAARGVVMYRDVFDIKGPYLFTIQQAAYSIGGVSGRMALFAFQTVCISICLVSLDASCRLLVSDAAAGETKRALPWRLLTAGSFLFLLSYTLQFGNMSEEYSLPILCVSQYLMLRYRTKRMPRHPAAYAFFYGIGFGVLALMRITNACLLCCIVLCVLVDLVVKREFRNLFANMAAFVGGFALAAAPIVAYYASVGALGAMWDAAYGFAFTYAVGGGSQLNLVFFLPLAVLSVAAAIVSRNWFERMYALTALCAHLAIYRLGYGFPHYYQLIIPPTLACLAIVANRVGLLCARRWRALALALLAAVIVLPNLWNCAKDTGRVVYRICVNTSAPENSLRGRLAAALEGANPNAKDVYGQQPQIDALAVRDAIPAESWGNVYCTMPRWSLLSGVDSMNRYCQTPRLFAGISERIAAELEALFDEKPPRFVVESTVEPCFPELLDRGYRVKLCTGTFVLYEHAG